MATPVFDWSDYLTLAQQLANNTDEASHRTAISRAYYCVYHKGVEWAAPKGYVDQKRHVALWDFCKRNSSNRARMKLSLLGDRMKKERAEADYNPAAARITQRMNVQLQRAAQFLSSLPTTP